MLAALNPQYTKEEEVEKAWRDYLEKIVADGLADKSALKWELQGDGNEA